MTTHAASSAAPHFPSEPGTFVARTYSTGEVARLYADHLRFADSVVHMMLKGFPREQWHVQPSPTDNHVLWCLGHLARSNDWFASMFDGAPMRLPESYKPLFGFGSSPQPSAGAYPPADELLEAYKQSLTRLIGVVEACTDFDAPAAIDTGGFVKNKHEGATRAAFHLGWHIGHISSVRRALNLPSAFA